MSTEAESGHGRHYLFSFCYLKITKKIILLSQDNGSFSCDNGLKKPVVSSFLLILIRDLECHQLQHVDGS